MFNTTGSTCLGVRKNKLYRINNIETFEQKIVFGHREEGRK